MSTQPPIPSDGARPAGDGGGERRLVDRAMSAVRGVLRGGAAPAPHDTVATPLDRLLAHFGACHLTAVEGLPIVIDVIGGDPGADASVTGMDTGTGTGARVARRLGPTWGDRWELRRAVSTGRNGIQTDLLVWLEPGPPPDDVIAGVRPGGLVVGRPDAIDADAADAGTVHADGLVEIDRHTLEGETLVVWRRPTFASTPPSPLASSRRGRMGRDA